MADEQVRTRRQLLGEAAAIGAGVGITSMMSEGQETKKSGQLKPWVIACRDAHLREVDGAPNCWAAMDTIGVEGVEIIVHANGSCPDLFGAETPFSIADDPGVDRLTDALKQHRRQVTAFCLANRFDERLDAEVALTVRVTEVAQRLGVPAIRLDVVPRKLKDDPAGFLKFAIDTGRRLIRETEGSEVRYGVENHATTTNKIDFLDQLFEGVGSDRFGLTLDTANFYWFGYPLTKLYEIYDRFGSRVFHTHCKSVNYPEEQRERQREMGWEYGKYCCPVDQGDIDFRKVAAILRKHGYTGDLCIENESLGRFPKEERGEILKREAAFLRKL